MTPASSTMERFYMLNDDDSKLATSLGVGILGFLASHIFNRVTRKVDAQDGLTTETKLLAAQVERLEEDLRELKHTLSEHIRDQRRRYDDDR